MNDIVLTQLKALVERVVAPLLASSGRKQKFREELLAHVIAVFEEEHAKLGDDHAALKQTTRRFGVPAELTRQLQGSITPLGYVAWFLDAAWLLRGKQTVISHSRMYTALLAVLCFHVAGGFALLAWIMGIPPESRPDLQWPDWSLPYFAVINAFYLTAMILTLVVRLVWPNAGKPLTKIMNLLFLLSPPLGTALGIYGIWWADCELKPEASK